MNSTCGNPDGKWVFWLTWFLLAVIDIICSHWNFAFSRKPLKQTILISIILSTSSLVRPLCVHKKIGSNQRYLIEYLLVETIIQLIANSIPCEAGKFSVKISKV